MEITNAHGLTQATVNAIKNDGYDRGESDFTVTELLRPPQQRYLQAKYKDEIVEDAADRIWSLFGQSVHSILEKAESNEIKEERYYADVDGFKIGGQVDCLDLEKGILTDYKVTSVWSYIHGKGEWVQQLNMLRYLLVKNGFEINKLQVQGLWRDFSAIKAGVNAIYPDAPASIVDIPIWKDEVTLNFLKEKIKDSESRPCAENETWYSGDKYAVMKEGRKSALRVLDSRSDAYYWACQKDHAIGRDSGPELKKGISVIYRPGIHKRCERYCNVSKFCPQFAKPGE